MQTDGERLPLAVKDLGSSDIYPQSLQHSPNGRFVTVCGDGEYVIYTALAWRNKSFGQALEFVWGDDSNVFATRESSSTSEWAAGWGWKVGGWSMKSMHRTKLQEQLLSTGPLPHCDLFVFFSILNHTRLTPMADPSPFLPPSLLQSRSTATSRRH